MFRKFYKRLGYAQFWNQLGPLCFLSNVQGGPRQSSIVGTLYYQCIFVFWGKSLNKLHSMNCNIYGLLWMIQSEITLANFEVSGEQNIDSSMAKISFWYDESKDLCFYLFVFHKSNIMYPYRFTKIPEIRR